MVGVPAEIKQCMHGVRAGAIPRLEGPYWQADGFHPNAKAQPLIANALLQMLVANKHVDEAKFSCDVPEHTDEGCLCRIQ